MRVVAKFKCESVLQFREGEHVSLTVVTSDTAENKVWSRYTPNGNLSMMITNEEALGQFKPGVEYLITIEKASLA